MGNKITRQEAVEKLAEFGIEGKNLYLVDIIPLIEMIWADGKAQEGELKILSAFLKTHVDNLNKNAGFEFMDYDCAKNFALAFLRTRPNKELMTTLRFLAASVISSQSNSRSVKESMLAACLDIASSSVVKYPYGLGERFDIHEKKCFYNIVKELED